MSKIDIEQLVTVDETGLPKAPSITQLFDKDIKMLYVRDTTKDKTRFLAELGLIHQLGNPKSAFKQEGLSDRDIIKKCIEYYDLPKTYNPDVLVLKIAKRHYMECITPAGQALELLQRAIRNEILIINKLNEILTDKLSGELSIEDANVIVDVCKNLNDKAKSIPELSRAVQEAYDNILYEKEMSTARGGENILSSMVDDDF